MNDALLIAASWGPAVVPGRRHSVRWEFDGLDHRLLVDGAEVQGPQPLDPVPAARSLKVGRYEIPGPEFAFRGTIGKVRVIRDVTSAVDRRSAR